VVSPSRPWEQLAIRPKGPRLGLGDAQTEGAPGGAACPEPAKRGACLQSGVVVPAQNPEKLCSHQLWKFLLLMQPELTNAAWSHPCDMNNAQLIQTLTESFIALSDEVQSLIDRKTILEHKLRYAHEQVCQYISSCPSTPAFVMIS